MTIVNENHADEELEDSLEDAEEEGDEFPETDGEPDSDALEEFVEEEVEGTEDDDIEAVVELSSKEQSARSLVIRRAIEERLEDRQLHDDLDYLDDEFDD